MGIAAPLPRCFVISGGSTVVRCEAQGLENVDAAALAGAQAAFDALFGGNPPADATIEEVEIAAVNTSGATSAGNAMGG